MRSRRLPRALDELQASMIVIRARCSISRSSLTSGRWASADSPTRCARHWSAAGPRFGKSRAAFTDGAGMTVPSELARVTGRPRQGSAARSSRKATRRAGARCVSADQRRSAVRSRMTFFSCARTAGRRRLRRHLRRSRNVARRRPSTPVACRKPAHRQRGVCQSTSRMQRFLKRLSDEVRAYAFGSGAGSRLYIEKRRRIPFDLFTKRRWSSANDGPGSATTLL